MATLSPEDSRRLLEIRAKVKAECLASYAAFVKRAWLFVSPDPELVWGDAQEIICEHLEAVWAGKISKLIVNIPPRTGKSRLVSICFPAWVWLHAPKTQFIVASHGDKVLQDFGQSLVKLLRSDFYMRLQPDAAVEANVARTNIVNKSGGTWFGTTAPHGQLMGIGGDILIFDDVIDPDGADKKENQSVRQWIPETFMSRANRKDRAKFIGVGQRLREDDPYGFCIEQGWFPLVMPSRYEGGAQVATMPNGEEIIQDLRSAPGELLCPELLPASYLDNVEKLYPHIFHGQYQQMPSPAGGGVIKEDWCKQRWDRLPQKGTWLISVDASFTGKDTSDFNALQVWIFDRPNYYLVDQIRRRMYFQDTAAALEALAARYPLAFTKIIENKANGPAIIDLLRQRIGGLVAVNPEGGKESRLNGAQAAFAGGNVWLPKLFASDTETTVDMYVHELTVFPQGKFDDMCDATSQAILYLTTQNNQMHIASDNCLRALAGVPFSDLPITASVTTPGSYQAWRNSRRGKV